MSNIANCDTPHSVSTIASHTSQPLSRAYRPSLSCTVGRPTQLKRLHSGPRRTLGSTITRWQCYTKMVYAILPTNVVLLYDNTNQGVNSHLLHPDRSNSVTVLAFILEYYVVFPNCSITRLTTFYLRTDHVKPRRSILWRNAT